MSCSFVNPANLGACEGLPRSTAYAASKHGIIGITRTAAKDLGPQNIRINAIAPGIIRTPMTQELERYWKESFDALASSMPLGRRGEPEEVARLIAFLLSDDASYITGAVYEIDAGYTA